MNLKNPRFRKIFIEFKPTGGSELLVPAIFSPPSQGFDDGRDMGFTVVTDEPTPEIENASHDTCPVILTWKEIRLWLNPKSMGADEFIEMLSNRKKPVCEHRLAEAA